MLSWFKSHRKKAEAVLQQDTATRGCKVLAKQLAGSTELGCNQLRAVARSKANRPHACSLFIFGCDWRCWLQSPWSLNCPATALISPPLPLLSPSCFQSLSPAFHPFIQQLDHSGELLVTTFKQCLPTQILSEDPHDWHFPVVMLKRQRAAEKLWSEIFLSYQYAIHFQVISVDGFESLTQTMIVNLPELPVLTKSQWHTCYRFTTTDRDLWYLLWTSHL